MAARTCYRVRLREPVARSAGHRRSISERSSWAFAQPDALAWRAAAARGLMTLGAAVHRLSVAATLIALGAVLGVYADGRADLIVGAAVVVGTRLGLAVTGVGLAAAGWALLPHDHRAALSAIREYADSLDYR